MELGLADKVVIVTGAASGIGAAIARALVAEGAALLLLTDRDDAGCRGLAAALGVASFTADLTDPDAPTPRRPGAPARIVAACTARFGRVDGLVNAAGLTARGSFVTGTPAVWDALFAVNARTAFFLMQAVIDFEQKVAGAI